VKARKIGLLLLILGFGAVTEVGYQVRDELSVGPTGCRVLSGRFHGRSHSFDIERSVRLAGAATVEIENAFGGVRVGAGAPGQVQVRLRKVVFLPDEDRARSFAERIEMNTEVSDSALRIATNRRPLERDHAEVGFETHLEVTVPAGTSLRVRNQHGRVEATDLASADLESSYDSLRVERVGGGVRLRNRHGEVFASAIEGALEVLSRGGRVEMEDIRGPATVEVERGDVVASRLASLNLKLSYGDLAARQLGGDLEVEGAQAAVVATEIAGGAVIATSYRPVELNGIGGAVRITADRAEVRVAHAKAGVQVETSYDDVHLSEIAGPLEVEVRHGGVQASGLAQGARVRSSGDDVDIERFRGDIHVETRRGAVHLVPEGPVTHAIFVSASYGDVSLVVPEGSSFDLEVAAASGNIDAELPGLEAGEAGPERLLGRFGSGGVPVELRTEHGQVSLSAPKQPEASPPQR